MLVLESDLDKFNSSRKYEYFIVLMIVLYCMSGRKEGRSLSSLHTICVVNTNSERNGDKVTPLDSVMKHTKMTRYILQVR